MASSPHPQAATVGPSAGGPWAQDASWTKACSCRREAGGTRSCKAWTRPHPVPEGPEPLKAGDAMRPPTRPPCPPPSLLPGQPGVAPRGGHPRNSSVTEPQQAQPKPRTWQPDSLLVDFMGIKFHRKSFYFQLIQDKNEQEKQKCLGMKWEGKFVLTQTAALHLSELNGKRMNPASD